MRFDIVPGAVFPDYELTDYSAKRLRLSELQRHDPMILILSRGGFCPNERRQHEGLVQRHRLLEVVYCRLVTIITDNVIETNEFHSGVGAHWPFLSDDSVWGSTTGRSLPLDGDEIDRLSQQSSGTAPVTGIDLVPAIGVCAVAAGKEHSM